jgi:hypothetical protein
MQIGDLLKVQDKTICKSERAQIIKEIYSYYTSPLEKILRKKENWVRYINWLKENKIKHSPESVKKFKTVKLKDKQKEFIKEMPIKSFCYIISHIKTPDLYYLKSQAHDRSFRGESFSKYFFWAIKA